MTPPSAAADTPAAVDKRATAGKQRPKPPVLRCERTSKKRLACRGLPAKLGKPKAKVKLFRAGKLYAIGRIRGGELKLRLLARVTPRRYRLRVSAPGSTLLVRVASMR